MLDLRTAVLATCCLTPALACTAPPPCNDGERIECKCPEGSVGERLCNDRRVGPCTCEPLLEAEFLVPTDAEMFASVDFRRLADVGFSRAEARRLAETAEVEGAIDALFRCDPNGSRVERMVFAKGKLIEPDSLLVLTGLALEAEAMQRCLERAGFGSDGSALGFDGETWHSGEHQLELVVVDRRTLLFVTPSWRDAALARVQLREPLTLASEAGDLANRDAPVWALMRQDDAVAGGLTVTPGDRISTRARVRLVPETLVDDIGADSFESTMKTALAGIISKPSAESLKIDVERGGTMRLDISLTLDDIDAMVGQGRAMGGS